MMWRPSNTFFRAVRKRRKSGRVVLEVQRLKRLNFRDGWKANTDARIQCYNTKEWPNPFAIAIWWLWRWRNDEKFNNNMETKGKIDLILNIQSEVGRAFNKVMDSNGGMKKKENQLLKWSKPEEGSIALNVDGCRVENNLHTGCGEGSLETRMAARLVAS